MDNWNSNNIACHADICHLHIAKFNYHTLFLFNVVSSGFYDPHKSSITTIIVVIIKF